MGYWDDGLQEIAGEDIVVPFSARVAQILDPDTYDPQPAVLFRLREGAEDGLVFVLGEEAAETLGLQLLTYVQTARRLRDAASSAPDVAVP